ncbi:hypothetical protein C8F04DRAFT_313936 [Mycena alexandri]|uniref:DUF7918 domain-containing protein n=1 Tax=Mycena alexandri TaxID=1745969 RepID=A0AAD6S353_9AGAR|nr:hypothetical protein C8F04DRAFT_313936 [Mycena alexandri]
MLHLNGFSAWITIDGQEIAEYDIQTSEDEKNVTCWVAAELGKKFSVWWRNNSHAAPVAGALKMDGNFCNAKAMTSRLLPNTLENKGVTNGTTLRPFIFSTLVLTDDDSFLDSSSHPELGVIELNITPVQLMQRNAVMNEPFPLHSLSELKVHERSKKAVTQQILLAQPEASENPVIAVNGVRTGPDIVKFSFKYRPLDVLRANGIAPQLKRKASLEASPRARTPEDEEELADIREAEMLRDRLKALDAKLQKRDKKPRVKVERVGEITQNRSQSNKRVKLEERRPFIQGEVIDLT